MLEQYIGRPQIPLLLFSSHRSESLPSSLSPSPTRGMDGVGEESLLQRMAKDSAPAVSKDNAGKKHCIDLSTEDTDNRENLFAWSKNGSDMSATSEAIPPTRRAKKGGGCNPRKSLAWNKAFFTEEGVLDPLELSILSGSANKSSASLVNGINGEISPLVSYSNSNRVDLNSKMYQGSAFDHKKGGDLFSTVESSGRKDSVPHMVPEKATLLCKGICRSIPRSPAVFSQKRLANSSTPNPASKLPRFTVTRLQTSSLTPTARCGVPTKGHSSQNVKPANIEKNARSKGSLLTPNKDLLASSSRNSEHEKKTVNETPELPSSADPQTSEMGKCISYLRTPQSHLPPNRLPASVGSSNFEQVAHSYSQNAHYLQGRHPPAQGQGKPSGLRMPTPSLGFFCQAKIPPHGLQLQKESQKSSASECTSQSLKNSHSLKHTEDFKTPHVSQGRGQPGVSESTGRKVSAVVSTPLGSRNAGYSGNLIVPSVANPTLGKDIDREASKGKILRKAIKPQVARSHENDEDELHSYCLMDEGNLGKQSGSQGSGCEHEFPNRLLSSADNSSVPVERKIADTLTQTNDFENAGGISLASEDYERHQLVERNVMLQKCSPKQLQQGACGMGESVMCQPWEDACEASVSTGNECSPDEKHDSLCCLSYESNEKVVDTCLKCGEMSIAGRTSLPPVCSSTENVVSPVEGENTECAVHGVGQHELNHGTILLEEVHGAEKSEHQNCGVSSPRKKNQIASQDKSEIILNKQELVEEPKQVSSLLYELKVAPFSDEWIAALESFGEGVLQMKTGSVQNSPPDKQTPELGPWSPVKRKNQDVGPYDCTKYNKSLSTASTP